jgi:hypothetical protein
VPSLHSDTAEALVWPVSTALLISDLASNPGLLPNLSS